MFFDDLETRHNDERIADIAEQLPKQIVRAAALSGYNGALQEFDASTVKTLSDLASLPVLRKSDLTKAQTVGNVLGGFNARKISDFAHIFQSPGPIYGPGGIDKNWWRMGRVLHALGIGKGDIVQNCFGYHLTLAGLIFESGARSEGGGGAGGGWTNQITGACGG